MIYEPNVRWLSQELMSQIPLGKVAFVNDDVPEVLSPSEIRAVVFSTVQPRQAPMNLLKWALEHRIPTIALEESNQIALNDGAINNYLLPVDHLLVASPAERRGLIKAGVSERRIEVTGWPFCLGSGESDPEHRQKAKTQLGLDPDRPVAALTLTAFNEIGRAHV